MSDETIQTQAVAIRPAMSVGQAMGVQEIIAQVNLIQEVMGKVMHEGEHYGAIPGCGDKKTLLQPGAQKLTMTFRLAPEYQIQEVNLDRGHKEYRVTCTLRSMGSGAFVGQGVGCCSTMESKYRYRGGARKCPECGKETIIKGKAEFGGGWLCWQKKGGCGFKWPDGAAEIESQSIDKVENENPADCYNTVLKMAKKRAFVDATITATAASDIFTQDIGDEEAEPGDAHAAEKTAPKTQASAPKAKTTPTDQEKADKTALVASLRKLCGNMEPEVLRFLRDCPAKSGKFLLMPNEGFDDMELADLKAMVNRWDNGYPKIEEWLREHPAKTVLAETMKEPPPIQVPRDPPGAGAPDEWFMKVIVPVPHKGQKRDEYLKSPDTIGSLYESMKGGDGEAAHRLWGFARHFEPKGWEKKDGTKMPASEADKKFREALDAFVEVHGKEAEAPQEDPDEDSVPF